MSEVHENQPEGTPTWMELGVPELDRALEFYSSVFGWEFDVGAEEYGGYTTCLLGGRRVAAISGQSDPTAGVFWNVYLATDDCDRTAEKVREAGGSLLVEPMDVMDQGRMAIVRDPVGAQFGLWQGRAHTGAEVVNEPGALVRNDLVTPTPEPAREFYSAVFGFTLDRNEDMPEANFTFLRRPDGHEVGGIFGAPGSVSAWATTFEVADTDEAVRRALEGGGTSDGAKDFLYGRLATITDPFGAEFSVITRPTD
jgi:predicted enzyme related to lactoylglutathione lyase